MGLPDWVFPVPLEKTENIIVKVEQSQLFHPGSPLMADPPVWAPHGPDDWQSCGPLRKIVLFIYGERNFWWDSPHGIHLLPPPPPRMSFAFSSFLLFLYFLLIPFFGAFWRFRFFTSMSDVQIAKSVAFERWFKLSKPQKFKLFVFCIFFLFWRGA